MENFENIATLNDLALLLRIPKKKLTYILYKVKPNNSYQSFKIPKKNGGEREISTPSDDLKDIQKSIVEVLWKHQKIIWEKYNIKPNISHAFIKDKSILTNAKLHRNKRYVFNLDLESFFDCFHFGRVQGFFEKNRDFLFPNNISTVLAQLTCYNASLPQGAPSSPIITNLICNILDMRLLKISKKFKLDYTRYADDLTFSTNDKFFYENIEKFKKEISDVIHASGFAINHKKTRLQYKNARQVVTGLVVNKKVNIKKEFYKATRAMANKLYKTGEFEINGEKATINQLEGRFTFINQIDRYNNLKSKSSSLQSKSSNLSSREKQYQMFLFYKYFFANNKPCMITEGKTDILYIQAALKSLYLEYPELIEKQGDKFIFKVSFLNKTKRLKHFFELHLDGADAMTKLYNFYSNANNQNYPNYTKKFLELGSKPSNPVIFILDNELNNKEKPLSKLVKNIRLINDSPEYKLFEKNLFTNIDSNLYLSTHQLVNGLPECEIEDLFDDTTLNVKLSGKTFDRTLKKPNNEKNYSKHIFSEYVLKNYNNIDFKNFRPLLNAIKEIVINFP